MSKNNDKMTPIEDLAIYKIYHPEGFKKKKRIDKQYKAWKFPPKKKKKNKGGGKIMIGYKAGGKV
jgi:hypothetical protein